MKTKQLTENYSQNFIIAKNLGKRYNFLWALKKVSFEIEKGSIIGVIGPNGSGKSTLLQLLANVIDPTIGSLSIFGRSIKTKSERLRKETVLYSYYSFFYDDLNGIDNLIFWSKLYHIKIPKEYSSLKSYILSRAKDFGVDKWLYRPIRELSTGMRKKVEFLRILLIQPKLILLDEPFSGMDQKNREQFLTKILELKNHSTIFLASHDVNLVSKITDITLCLQKGILVNIIEKGISNIEEYRQNLLSTFQ